MRILRLLPGWIHLVSWRHPPCLSAAKEILERDGLNELEKPPKPTLLILFLMQQLVFEF